MSLSSPQPGIKSSAAPRRARKGAPRAPHRRPIAAAAVTFPVPRRQSRITIEGALFINLALILGLAAVHSGHNLLYLVFSVMLAMLLLSGNVARTNIAKLSVERHYPLEFHAGQEAYGHIDLRNGKRFFNSYALRVQDFLFVPPMGGRKAAPFPIMTLGAIIRAQQTVHCPVILRLERRGLYKLVSIQVISRFPFGFFQRARRIDMGGQILVYPPIVSATVLRKSFSLAPGDLETDRKGQGIGLFGIRNYERGDPARLIHWKHSAKGMGLKLKEFEEERAQSYRIMLDLRCGEDPSAEMWDDFEKAITVAASFAHFLIHKQASVALWTTQGRVPAAAGRVQLQRIMRALAAVTPQPLDAVPPPIDNDTVNLSTLWIEYRDEKHGSAQFSIPRPFSTRVIDARKIEIDEPVAPPNGPSTPQAEASRHGN